MKDNSSILTLLLEEVKQILKKMLQEERRIYLENYPETKVMVIMPVICSCPVGNWGAYASREVGMVVSRVSFCLTVSVV